jgi:hypothetical protein
MAYRFYNGEAVILVVVDMAHVAGTPSGHGYLVRPSKKLGMSWEVEWVGGCALYLDCVIEV